jgi:hypothetical protein
VDDLGSGDMLRGEEDHQIRRIRDVAHEFTEMRRRTERHARDVVQARRQGRRQPVSGQVGKRHAEAATSDGSRRPLRLG